LQEKDQKKELKSVLKKIKELNEASEDSSLMINRDILIQNFIMIMGRYNHN
jgi:hypothetical protein